MKLTKKSFSLPFLEHIFGMQDTIDLGMGDREIYEEDAFSDYEVVVEDGVEIPNEIDTDNGL